MDDVEEVTSQSFKDYCMSIGIMVEHSVSQMHTQNSLAESLIKRLQLIGRPLLMRTNFSNYAWGHAILHKVSPVRLRPTSCHKYSSMQLVNGQKSNISHLIVFECAVYVPISPPRRTKMRPQRKLGVYVGFNSPSIIKYLDPMTGDLCHILVPKYKLTKYF